MCFSSTLYSLRGFLCLVLSYFLCAEPGLVKNSFSAVSRRLKTERTECLTWETPPAERVPPTKKTQPSPLLDKGMLLRKHARNSKGLQNLPLWTGSPSVQVSWVTGNAAAPLFSGSLEPCCRRMKVKCWQNLEWLPIGGKLQKESVPLPAVSAELWEPLQSPAGCPPACLPRSAKRILTCWQQR